MDAGRRLVVTNYHVAKKSPQLAVVFPAYDAKKQLITEMDYYDKNAERLTILARIVDSAPGKDLAVLQLEKLPDDARPVTFSSRPAPTGAAVYSIGASGVDRNLLWKLTSGLVSGRSNREVRTDSGKLSAVILETSAGVNPGDSGGPVVNDRAELVGVVAHYDRQQRDVSGNIDLEEVNTFLRDAARKGGWTWKPPVSTEPGSVADDPTDLKKLIGLLGSPDAAKRLDAVQRLAALGADARPAVAGLIPLLDDADERVRVAAGVALAKVGPLTDADAGGLNIALRGGGANARLLALRFYADPPQKLPEHLLPDVVRGAADPSPEARRAAVRVLGTYGPGCKSQALGKLFDLLGDDDAVVVAEATRVLAGFAPFTEGDRLTLVGRLTHSKATVRLAAATILAPETPDAATAVKWFHLPILDTDARVRAKAIEAVAKWGAKAKDCLAAILGRIEDDSPLVAAAAVRAAAAIDGGPTVLQQLNQLLVAVDTRGEVRAAVCEALLAMPLPQDAAGVATLVAILAAEKPETRVAALTQLGKYGATAKPAIEAIAGRLADPDENVRLASLATLAPFGADAAAAIPAVAGLLNEKQPSPVAAAAAATLGKLGTKAIEPLTKALEAKLPKPVLIGVCSALAGYGRDAQAAGPALFNAINRQPILSELATQATDAVANREQPWVPDPVGAALAKVGGDKVVGLLLEMTAYEVKTVGGVKTRVATKGDGAMLWAVLVLSSLDPQTLTDKGREQVRTSLDALVTYAPTAACRETAKLALPRFTPKR